MTVLEVLQKIDRNSVPLNNVDNGDIRNECGDTVIISYMTEEETWIKTYPCHPILRGIYDKEVEALGVYDGSIQIWIAQKDWI